ncbi:hypothetical protein G4D82_12320 [Flavobacterium sp. CYK-4]|uniref:hypothetical protein n=1 Tax=Flavobacterium lotistagni TaxID=2709660 RepID=UPI00140C9CA8|nr:hypothetical protein [Flavobacterium lotistagni]NHM08011.1 hypothetical protein [Flavobacterium lotistagni]
MIDEIKVSEMNWLLDVPGDALLYVVKDGQDYKTTKNALLSSLGVGLFVPEGLGMVINRSIEWIQDNFDLDSESPNYLSGISTMVGWRIKPQNGGRVSVGWHPANYPNIGDIGGSEDAVVGQHVHKTVVWSDGKPGVNTLGTGASVPGRAMGESSATDKINYTSVEGESVVGKNMQPYIVELHIERASDAFIGGNGLNKKEYCAYITYNPSTPTIPTVVEDGNNFGGITWVWDDENSTLNGAGDFSGRVYWSIPPFLLPSIQAPASNFVSHTGTVFSIVFLDHTWAPTSEVFENNPIQVSIYKF